MAENIHLKYLIDRFASNTCTREEFDQLLALVGNMEEEELTEEMSRYWDKDPINDSISPEWKERLLMLPHEPARLQEAASPVVNLHGTIIRRWVAAAAILIALAGGYLLSQKSRDTTRSLAGAQKTKEPATAIAPARNRAVLTLADGSAISLDSASMGTIALQGRVRISKGATGEILYHPDGHKTLSPGYNTITIPKGGKYYVVLSDGTKVWLNAASSLRFPAEFTNGKREVTLTGEAYFEVAKNVSHPFQVTAGKMIVEVLGTQFNLNAYGEEGRVSTTLVQGAIRIANTAAGSSSHGVLLKPGEQANLGDHGPLILDRSPNMEEVVAWKNGNFYFSNTPVPVILREISRWYDLEIVYEGSPPDKKLTGTFSRNVGLEQLTAMLQFIGININITNKQLIILRN